MNLVDKVGRDERLSSSTRLVGAAILQQIDPLTGRARVTAEQFAGTLEVAVGTVRKATSALTSTTLADSFKLHSCADPCSAVRASLRWRSKHEIGDGVTHRWQAWLRRWSIDSFFPAPLL
jgi:hypothetical protein